MTARFAPDTHRQVDPVVLGELSAGLIGVLLAGTAVFPEPATVLAASAVYLVMAALVLAGRSGQRGGLGWANRITLLRGVLVCVLAGGLVAPEAVAERTWIVAGLALTALMLDGLDGWLARRTATTSAFGARFDMELDAFLILVLCMNLVALEQVGVWALAVGAMRYVFLLAGWRWRWLAAPLPESRRRKSVCVWQVLALMIALIPGVGTTQSTWLVATALAALTGSFVVDIRWLYGRARE
jgi:phosphatidylglycerophosphate synthase